MWAFPPRYSCGGFVAPTRASPALHRQDLIQDGLYKALAIAFYTPPFRHISSCLVARHLGAMDVGSAKARRTAALRKLGSSRSVLVSKVTSKSDSANAEVEAVSMSTTEFVDGCASSCSAQNAAPVLPKVSAPSMPPSAPSMPDP